MSSYRDGDGDGDPNAGRNTLWVVAGIGLAAVVGYGVVQAGRAAQAPAPVAPQVQPTETVRASITELSSAVEGARQDLDVAALAKLEEQLARAAEQTTMKQRAAEAKLARLEALSTRALEAAVRSKQTNADTAGAERTAQVTITQGRSALANLKKEAVGLDAARLRAAEARLALASGDDITESHPMVLLPTFRDPELRLAALSRPVWFEQRNGDDEVLEVVEELSRADPKTALTRSILAVALHSKGDDEAARSEVNSVLTRVPSQPLALALKRTIGGDPAAVAMADPTPTDPPPAVVPEPVPEDVPSPSPAAPTPTPGPTSAPTPEPTPDPGVKLEPVDPTPAAGTKLEPVDPIRPPASKAQPAVEPKPKPEPEPKPKPEAKPKPKPKPASGGGFDDLVAQGCKDVRSGDAEAGLSSLRKAFDMKPGSAKVTLCMAEGQAKLGRDASAAALVDRVLKKSPNNVKARLLAGKLAAKSGNKSAALEHYRKVLEIQPDNAKAKAYVEKNG